MDYQPSRGVILKEIDSGVARMSTVLVMLVIGAALCAIIISIYEILARRSLSRLRH